MIYWNPTPIVEGALHGKVKPYTRAIKGHWKPDATAYKKSQARVGAALLEAAAALPSGWRGCTPCRATGRVRKAVRPCSACGGSGSVRAARILVPYRFGLVVWMPTTKAGELPLTGGDWDNFVKAWLDAAQDVALVEDDGPRWFRGPAPVGETPSGVYAAPDWRFEWAFYEATDPVCTAPAPTQLTLEG